MREDPKLHPLRWRDAWPHLLLVFSSALALYAATAPRTVAFEDDGGFIMAARFLGIAHPPGYPLWVLLAKPFTWLPIESVAYRVHLASAVFGAGGCAALWWVIRRLVSSGWIATAVALAFAVSEVMWSQSLIADVYSLNVLLYFALFAQALGVLEHSTRVRWMGLGLLYGLALSNHWPLVVLGTPCLALVLWPRWRELSRQAGFAAIAMAVGLTPYLWMVLRSHSDPTVSFYGPIRSFEELFYYVSRQGYTEVQQDTTAEFADKLRFAGFLLRQAAIQFTPVGALVAVGGLVASFRRTRVSWNAALLLGFAGGGLALVPTFNVSYDYLERLQVRVFPLIPYGIAAIWLAFGLERVLAWARRVAPLHGSRVFAGVIGVWVFGLLCWNLPLNDRSDYRLAEDYGRTLLESLAPGAILFTNHDFDVFTLGYLNLVAGVRPDVTLYHRSGLVFPSRLFHARTEPEVRARIVREFASGNSRPVYFIRRPASDRAFEEFGLYVRLDPNRSPGDRQYTLREDLLSLVGRVREGPDLRDGWTLAFSRGVVSDFATHLMRVVLADPEAVGSELRRAKLEELRSDYYGLVGQLYAALPGGQISAEVLLAWAEQAEALADDKVGDRHRSRLHHAKGQLLEGLGRHAEALESFQVSVDLYPDLENEAAVGLMRELARAGRRDDYVEIRRRFFQNRVGPEEVLALDRELGL